MHRRDVLKGLSVMLGGTLSSACQQAVQIPQAQRIVAAPIYDMTQRDIAYRVADLILPVTDTPGALDAGVGEFIDYVVTQWFTEQEQKRFLAGLDALAEAALKTFGAPFLTLDMQQQVSLLEQAEAQETNVRDDMTQPFGAGSFFKQIKELTVVGYYTSEVGATQERKYTPMPGYYDGYHKFANVGRQWSS